MATIAFRCPQCNKPLKADRNSGGKTARCPSCSAQFTIPATVPEPAAPIVAEAVAPIQRTKTCRFCGEQVLAAAAKCKHCGEWLQRAPGMPFAPTAPAHFKVVPAANAVIFTIITLGIYQIFWLYRVFKELHSRGTTGITPGKAVGFCFIPFFNFIWIFIVWKEVGDAIYREYARAGLQPPSTGLVWLAPIGTLIGFFLNLGVPPAGSVIIMILLPISLGNAQAWLNQLSNVSVGGMPGYVTGLPPAQISPLTKACPTCGEHISMDAMLCPSCGQQFSEADVAQVRQQRDQQLARMAEQQRQQRIVSLRSRKTVLQVFGWILTVVGSLFVLLCLVGLIVGPVDAGKASEHIIGFVGAVIIFCLPPLGLGLLLLWFSRKANAELRALGLRTQNGAYRAGSQADSRQ